MWRSRASAGREACARDRPKHSDIETGLIFTPLALAIEKIRTAELDVGNGNLFGVHVAGHLSGERLPAGDAVEHRAGIVGLSPHEGDNLWRLLIFKIAIGINDLLAEVGIGDWPDGRYWWRRDGAGHLRQRLEGKEENANVQQ